MAYRKLAQSLHPDLHPNDPAKKAEFQAVLNAYDLLKDPEKRRRFDAGEIDAAGHERAERQYYQDYARQDAGARYDTGPGGGFGGYEEDLSDVFSDLFGQRARGGGTRRAFHARGQGPAGDALVTITVEPHPVFTRDGDDIEIELPITFDEAVLGAKVDVPTISGPVSMTIPKGSSSGRRLRFPGKGIKRRKSAGGPPDACRSSRFRRIDAA